MDSPLVVAITKRAKETAMPATGDDEEAEGESEGTDYASVKASAVKDLFAAFKADDVAAGVAALGDFTEACRGESEETPEGESGSDAAS